MNQQFKTLCNLKKNILQIKKKRIKLYIEICNFKTSWLFKVCLFYGFHLKVKFSVTFCLPLLEVMPHYNFYQYLSFGKASQTYTHPQDIVNVCSDISSFIRCLIQAFIYHINIIFMWFITRDGNLCCNIRFLGHIFPFLFIVYTITC